MGVSSSSWPHQRLSQHTRRSLHCMNIPKPTPFLLKAGSQGATSCCSSVRTLTAQSLAHGRWDFFCQRSAEPLHTRGCGLERLRGCFERAKESGFLDRARPHWGSRTVRGGGQKAKGTMGHMPSTVAASSSSKTSPGRCRSSLLALHRAETQASRGKVSTQPLNCSMRLRGKAIWILSSSTALPGTENIFPGMQDTSLIDKHISKQDGDKF